MGPRLAATHRTPAGTNLTLLEIISSGAVFPQRLWVYDIVLGSDDAPASLAGQFDVIRGTVSGTGTVVPPRLLDPASPGASSNAKGGTFTGQTKTANSALLSMGLAQRQTLRWVARPGRELVVPATTDAWIGVESIAHGGVPNVNCSIMWSE